MAQLVHDVAPGSSQAFHTAFNGQADFANGIVELATTNVCWPCIGPQATPGCPVAACEAAVCAIDPFCCAVAWDSFCAGTVSSVCAKVPADVLVDDVIYFAEPMFQDGIIAQAVDTAKAQGVPYFSSAGNNGRDSYEAVYNAGFDPVFGLPAHDFSGGGGDFFQNVFIPENSGIAIVFQWDQPFFSVSGAPGSANDIDILLADDPPTGFFAGGTDANIGGDSVEIFSFFNPPGSGMTSFNLFITNFAGPNPGLMKYVILDLAGFVTEWFVPSGTTYGHAVAAGASGVGAAFYQDTPVFGVDPPVLESFSSAGLRQILFDTAGNPLPNLCPGASNCCVDQFPGLGCDDLGCQSHVCGVDSFCCLGGWDGFCAIEASDLCRGELRTKPDIVAPDGTNTTFFGGDVEPDGFPNFFGTSAAAPHAAAVAALMLQNTPAMTPDQVYGNLEATALDMGPLPGFDADSGHGLIQADKALGFIFTDGFESGDTTAWSSKVP